MIEQRIRCHMYFPKNNNFLHLNINLTSHFQYLFHWIKIIMKLEKWSHNKFTNEKSYLITSF